MFYNSHISLINRINTYDRPGQRKVDINSIILIKVTFELSFFKRLDLQLGGPQW